MIESRTPAPPHIDTDTQEVDWLDAIPVEIPPQYNQQNKQSIPTELTHPNLDSAEIPQLKDSRRLKETQGDYRSRLLALDDDKYYQEVDRHPQHRTIDWQIRFPVPTKLPKNLCKYLVRVGVRRVGENSMDIDLSVQEQDLCRATYSGRSGKHNG